MKLPMSCLLLLLVAAHSHATVPPTDRMTPIENGLRPDFTIEGDEPWTLEERMKEYGVPGVSIAVIRDFKVVEYRVYGLADRETGETATKNTLFQAGSVSKPVAAAGALKLVDRGKLSLDGNVNDWLESWKLPDNEFTKKEKVSLTHLLAHTGGLTVHGFPGYAVGEDVPTTIQVLNGSGPANTSAVRVDKVPGESYRYSGGGYTIAQLMMVDVAGKPFPELMDELVLKPAGMKRSTFLNPLPPKMLKNAAAGYLPDNSAVAGKRHTYPEMAAAGLWTTAEDLAKFGIEVQLALRGKSDVLQRTTAEQLVEPIAGHYGRGFGLMRHDRAPYFGHDGWDEGFCARLVAHRTAGYGAAVMINSNHPRLINEIIQGIAEEYGWAGYGPHPDLEVPQHALELFPGRYLYRDLAFSIERRENRLFMQYIGEDDAHELHYVGNGHYIRRERTTPIVFTLIDSIPTFHFVTGRDRWQTHLRLADGERAPREILIADGFEKALPVYRKIFQQSPDRFAVSNQWLVSQGNDLVARGQYEAAIGLLQIENSLRPGSSGTWSSLGDAYRHKGETKKALRSVQKALEIEPDLPYALKAAAELQAELEQGLVSCEAGSSTLADSTSSDALTVRVWVDGSTVVNVRGDTLWHESLSTVKPGTRPGLASNSGVEPTVVNGVAWLPEWDGRISRPFKAADGLLPSARAVTVKAIAFNDRGRCLVLKQPSPQSDFTFSLLLDDDREIGADWYEILLRW